jgi:hypothetical protein
MRIRSMAKVFWPGRMVECIVEDFLLIDDMVSAPSEHPRFPSLRFEKNCIKRTTWLIFISGSLLPRRTLWSWGAHPSNTLLC